MLLQPPTEGLAGTIEMMALPINATPLEPRSAVALLWARARAQPLPGSP
ncbi:hypothetical protein SAMCFNEI73_Ch2203 [Sinorhizobium americanum]|uniref:Uncharacterized protein n=1 Tax=Sinorhizobium americanum TaxID=194963 RepID=A0A1L3LN76_9HYPH|nr:hypothetical protein SAMCCGM7_Ch2097 [Sinorhizobium americanum CCGM7]APG91486.1 hypothetical protein SAMCFNEI73_Ch2203 [Sinorhizobium americanum]